MAPSQVSAGRRPHTRLLQSAGVEIHRISSWRHSRRKPYQDVQNVGLASADIEGITQEQAEKFRKEGALGAHLENLERNEGFKGFNQTGINEIIAGTDPRLTGANR